jgi:hypothetical protein
MGGGEYDDPRQLCTYHFGDYKPGKGGHIIIFDIPGAPPGECKLSFQPDKKKKGQAKTYQVEQALKAIDKYGRRDE